MFGEERLLFAHGPVTGRPPQTCSWLNGLGSPRLLGGEHRPGFASTAYTHWKHSSGPGRFLRPQSFPSGRAWHCQVQSKSRSFQRTPHLLQFLVACVPMQHSMVPIPSHRRVSFDQLMSNMNSGRGFHWEDQLQTSDLWSSKKTGHLLSSSHPNSFDLNF